MTQSRSTIEPHRRMKLKQTLNRPLSRPRPSGRQAANSFKPRTRDSRKSCAASIAQAGKREMVLSLLDVLDDFERALEHIDEAPASVSAGLVAIHRRLAGVLEAQGVIPFESVGRPFDPELHEAVGSVESDEQESGAVLDELRRGYRWGEELLRPARVRVAR